MNTEVECSNDLESLTIELLNKLESIIQNFIFKREREFNDLYV